MINNLPDENDKFTGNLDKLVDLVKKYILPQSKDTDIKRYLKLINYYYHYYSTVEGLILTESRKIEYAGSVDSVAFSPDSQYVATGYYDYLTVSYDYAKVTSGSSTSRPARSSTRSRTTLISARWRFHPTTSTSPRVPTTITSGSLTPRPVRYYTRSSTTIWSARWRFRPTASTSPLVPTTSTSGSSTSRTSRRSTRSSTAVMCLGGVFARQPVRRHG